MRKSKLFFALALAPMLMGAGGTASSVSSELVVDKLPTCAEDEYLMYSSGGLTCGKLTSGGSALQWPDCTGRLVTITRNGDVSSLSCTDKGRSGGAIDTTILVNLEKKVQDLGTEITKASNATGSGIGTWVGNSTKKSNGNLLTLNYTSDNALAAAAKVCSDDFGAGAHLCTTTEIYESAARGVIGSGKNIAKAWVYVANWNNPVAGSVRPNNGYGDNCGSYTYPTGDKNWKGTAVETGSNEETGRWSLKFIGGTDTSCAAELPVACCK